MSGDGGKRTFLVRAFGSCNKSGMSEGNWWLVMCGGVWAAAIVAALIWRRSHPERYAMGASAFCCLLMTIYVVLFEPDPQAPIFLFIFYVIAGLAGCAAVLCFRAGRWVSRWVGDS